LETLISMVYYLILILNIVLKSLALIVPLLIGVAYLTLLERKVMASMHQRRGPNVVGFFGMLQAFADGLKLFVKETILPSSANTLIFILAPIITSSLGVYGIITSGWSSNSKWSFLGSLRSAAQMISYEVSIGIIILCVLLCSGSLNLSEIVESQRKVWYILPLFPLFIMFFISGLAETNRSPFDLPEAEAELVSGYSTEYSAMGFALFFLGEYANMILMSTTVTIYFLGGWLSPIEFIPFTFVPGFFWFGLKTTAILFLFIWVRAAFPRYRYDQLMRLGWKVFLPFSLGWLLFISGILLGFDWLI